MGRLMALEVLDSFESFGAEGALEGGYVEMVLTGVAVEFALLLEGFGALGARVQVERGEGQELGDEGGAAGLGRGGILFDERGGGFMVRKGLLMGHNNDH